MSQKVSNRIVFEDYIYHNETRKKATKYYVCVYKKATVLHDAINIKTMLNLEGSSIPVKSQKNEIPKMILPKMRFPNLMRIH